MYKPKLSFILICFSFLSILNNYFIYAHDSNTVLSDRENASLSGIVMDKDNKETLIGANVIISDTKLGARTNKNGYFSIANIPPGTYNVKVSFLGYDKLIQKFTFKKDVNIRKDFELTQNDILKDEINVDAEREVEKRQISVSKVNVPIGTIKNFRIGGESDVFRTLQYLPGVLTSSQISSGLFVRGGSPDQNLILLDGSTVYNPTHLFGFISTFNSDAIKDVELVKGGFDAEYGGRLSAVLNLTQKDGGRNGVHGTASLGVISSKLGLEGPLPWEGGSWFVSNRRTYFELVKTAIPEDPTSPIPDFGFYDLNAKITQNFGSDDKVSLSGFMSNDNLIFSSFGLDLNLDIGNRLLAGRWTHIFDEHLFSTINVSFSKYFNNFIGDQSGYQFLIDNSITDYTAKGNLEWFVEDALTFKAGFESSKYQFTYMQNFTGNTDSTKQGSTGGSTNLTKEDWQHSLFAQLKWSITDLFSIQSGLRVNYWKLSYLITYDPRISFRYRFNENIALKAAYGIFHQNLRLASQPDFSFFDTWLPTDASVPASSSNHYILSLETEPEKGYYLNFDIYYKSFSNISELNRNNLKGENVADVFYLGNSDAWGAEIFLQKRFGKLNGWIGYALGFINAKFDSINNGNSFRPKYDRTHDFKIVLNYELNQDWSFGTSFLFQTGQSYTGVTSRFQSMLPGQTYGRGKVVPSQRYGLRLPPSHQLNLTASYNFFMWGLASKAIIDIYNVYSRRDILTRFYNTRDDQAYIEDVKLIPILPTISIEVKF
jgi:hypothetical protein